ncbi:MAG: hypothetical protein R3247_16930 [Rhodothermales bacterium]|nr:hypothetical protein [Rhodothermales bacterium]
MAGDASTPATTTEEITASRASAAKELLSAALSELRTIAQEASASNAAPRLFFPNGIEVISLTVKVSEFFEVTFKIAGEKGVSGLVEGISAGPDVFTRVLSPEPDEIPPH